VDPPSPISALQVQKSRKSRVKGSNVTGKCRNWRKRVESNIVSYFISYKKACGGSISQKVYLEPKWLRWLWGRCLEKDDCLQGQPKQHFAVYNLSRFQGVNGAISRRIIRINVQGRALRNLGTEPGLGTRSGEYSWFRRAPWNFGDSRIFLCFTTKVRVHITKW